MWGQNHTHFTKQTVNSLSSEILKATNQLTLEAVWIELVLVGAFGQGDNAWCSPVPASALCSADKVSNVVLGSGELPLWSSGIVVLAVDPVRMNPPVFVGKFVRNYNRKTLN